MLAGWFILTKIERRVSSKNLVILTQAMCMEYAEEKRELVKSIPKNRKLSDLPKIHQVHFLMSLSSSFLFGCSLPIFINIVYLVYVLPSVKELKNNKLLPIYHFSCSLL